MHKANSETLRLAARDEADLEVVSALLQDAIIPGVDLHFDVLNSCFSIAANRFCWERPPLPDVKTSSGGEVHERALCGLQFRHVIDVQKRQWPSDWRNSFFNILALKPLPMPKQDKGCVIEVSFSGGPSLRLLVHEINLVLVDLDSGHPTNLEPRHD